MRMRIILLATALCLLSAACPRSGAQAPALPSNLGDIQLRADTDASNWTLYGRNYSAWRYSPLMQITKGNAATMVPKWTFDTGMHQAFEATPIVVNGVMYITTPWNHVLALNAETGAQYWRYAYPMGEAHPILCCDSGNRGVGVGMGKVVMATLDAHVVGLDAATGKELWNTEMAKAEDGYSATTAPQIIGSKAIVGISGGEYGIRGFIDAYDINTGSRIWRFYTIPGPGEPGHETWAGDSWKTGGAPQWITVTYDPAMNTIFAGIGNTGPDLDGDKRGGDNLYADSVVALDADTGRLKWYYQTVPHDVWDLDCVVEPVIDDITIDGQVRKVVMFAPKNGYFYVLDRTNGKPIYAMQVVHKVNWGRVTPEGVPIPDKSMYPVENQQKIVWPGASGGKEWVSAAYDPQRKRMFIPLVEMPFAHTVIKQPYIAGEYYWGGTSGIVPNAYGHIAAVDVERRAVAWDARMTDPHLCSISCTASGLLITGTPDGRMLVMDSDTGNTVWTYIAASGWHSGPAIYSVNGKEYITFPNGWGGPNLGSGSPKLNNVPNINTIYTFTLP